MAISFPPGRDYLPPGKHQAVMSEIEAALVDGFSTSTVRRPLFESWQNVVRGLERVITIDEHWMDGSFVSTKVEPGDIDCLSIFDGPTFDALDGPDRTLIYALLLAKATQQLFGCDSYAISSYPVGDPNRPAYEAARAYWEGLFGADRKGTPKGFLEVTDR